MVNNKALLIQARDALQYAVMSSGGETGCDHEWQICFCKENAAIAALTAFIDAPEPEPAAWIVEFENGECELHWSDTKESLGETQTPLYTRPPAARQPLSDAEKQEIAENYFAEDWLIDKAINMAHDIEAAVRAKP